MPSLDMQGFELTRLVRHAQSPPMAARSPVGPSCAQKSGIPNRPPPKAAECFQVVICQMPKNWVLASHSSSTTASARAGQSQEEKGWAPSVPWNAKVELGQVRCSLKSKADCPIGLHWTRKKHCPFKRDCAPALSSRAPQSHRERSWNPSGRSRSVGKASRIRPCFSLASQSPIPPR